jgi:RNA polymerase sigma factor (sigma-70 family)
MAGAKRGAFLSRLLRGMVVETCSDQSDAHLIEHFLATRDEAVFEAIVRRHGPMVYRVCWRALQHSQDAEDAFQATFLILAQSLRTVRKHASLASWLHGVAHRVALKGRAQAATRHYHEHQASRPQAVPADDVTWGELRSALDAELALLPEKWRLPLILCQLEGRTQDEAARQLGWSKRTLRRRLDEARTALGRRLRRRGLWPAALSGVLLADGMAPATLPAGLVGLTAQAAAGIAAGQTAAAGALPAKVAALMEGAMKTMPMTNRKFAAVVLVVLGLLGAGAAAVGYRALAGGPAGLAPKADPPPGPPVLRGEPPAKPRSDPLEIRLVAKKATYVLDLGGKTPADFTRHVRAEEAKAIAAQPSNLPPAVSVDLVLELRNTGKKELALTLGGDASTLMLELKGPGALSAVAQGAFDQNLLLGKRVTIAPGKSHSLPITRLAYGKRGEQHRAYWCRAGAYTLTARLMTTEFRVHFVSAPVKLEVQDRNDDRQMIQGSWGAIYAELGGKELPAERLATMKLTVTGDRYTVKVGEQIDQGTIKLRPDQKPKAMDLVGTKGPNKGKTIRAIYEPAKGYLRIGYDLSGKARPAKFGTRTDTQLILIDYQIANTVRLRSAAKNTVEIEVTSARPFLPKAGVPVLSIGTVRSMVSRSPGGETTTIIFTMSAAEFARTKNGDRILVKYEPGSGRPWDCGKLDKSRLDK